MNHNKKAPFVPLVEIDGVAFVKLSFQERSKLPYMTSVVSQTAYSTHTGVLLVVLTTDPASRAQVLKEKSTSENESNTTA